MRVFYRSVRSVYRQGRVDFCCAAMCRWWGLLVGFGARGGSSTSNEVNLYLDRPQANGIGAVELVPIEHCPFCGEAVETCRAK